jgi:hypothetical protein
MRLPDGELLRSRAVDDLAALFEDALDRLLTGYAVLEPQDTLLAGGDGAGVITFADGVPVLAYSTATDRGGPPALADLAVPGPYHVRLVAVPDGSLDTVHDTSALTVPPAMPAQRLAGDAELADRTRRRAPATRTRSDAESGSTTDPTDDDPGALEAFLDDEEKIAAIREQAREEARERAREWGFDDLET